MIVARFKVQCRPDRTEDVVAAIAAVRAPVRVMRLRMRLRWFERTRLIAEAVLATAFSPE